VHEQHKANVVGIDGLTKWFKENHSFLWYRSGFNSDIKCDYITNNIAEVFNNWIKDHKDLPVCDLANKIRVMIMELFYEEKDWYQLEGNTLPSIINILRARIRGFGHLSLAKGDHYYAEVQDNNNVLAKHIVKDDLTYCSCLE
jgi:hypothetical protein